MVNFKPLYLPSSTTPSPLASLCSNLNSVLIAFVVLITVKSRLTSVSPADTA